MKRSTQWIAIYPDGKTEILTLVQAISRLKASCIVRVTRIHRKYRQPAVTCHTYTFIDHRQREFPGNTLALGKVTAAILDSESTAWCPVRQNNITLLPVRFTDTNGNHRTLNLSDSDPCTVIEMLVTILHYLCRLRTWPVFDLFYKYLGTN